MGESGNTPSVLSRRNPQPCRSVTASRYNMPLVKMYTVYFFLVTLKNLDHKSVCIRYRICFLTLTHVELSNAQSRTFPPSSPVTMYVPIIWTFPDNRKRRFPNEMTYRLNHNLYASDCCSVIECPIAFPRMKIPHCKSTVQIDTQHLTRTSHIFVTFQFVIR